MIKVDEKVLKGRIVLAQGKRRRSVALGYGKESKIVRVIAFFKEGAWMRTKMIVTRFFEIGLAQFRPKEVSRFDYLFFADGFHFIHFSQGDVSVVPSETIPWAEIFSPFRPLSITLNK
jgi:hypothetical protein